MSSLPQTPVAPVECIEVRGARVHNLKNVDFEIPHNALTVVTGVSGSGKSSLAFDTLYAEGQRRYVESLSAYARQFLERMEKPDVDEIAGIAPAVAIGQKNTTRNPRSTVGTTTEIYDYLRLLYARIGQTFCSQCGAEVKKDSVDEVADRLLQLPQEFGQPEGLRAYVLFPMFPVTAAAPAETAPADGGTAEGKPSGKLPAKNRKREQSRLPLKDSAASGARSRQANMERLKTRLFELRKRGFNRLFQAGEIFEFSTPESLLEIDFSQPVWVLADRLVISPESRQRLIDSLEACYREGGEAVVEIPGVTAPMPDGVPSETRLGSAAPPIRLTFNEQFECKTCRIVYQEPEPQLFSFNSPYGACPRCQGFGNTIDFDPQLVVPDPTLTLDQGAVDPWTKPRYRVFYNEFKKTARERGVRFDVPFFQLTPEEKEIVWEGSPESGKASRGRPSRRGGGVKGFFSYLDRKKYKLHVRVFVSRYRGYASCPECKGGRLRKEAFQVKVAGHDLRSVCQMSIEQSRQFFDTVRLTRTQESIADRILHEVRQRLRFLENVGLEYLTLDRLSSTLSGGEAQRIQLAASLGSSLVGTLYVLDEPSIGLHSRDTGRLIHILKELRDQGNTILVVEHDPAMMEAADHILDLGPGAGENGGRIQFAGTYPELLSRNSTLTGRYLNGDLRISLPSHRQAVTSRQIKIHGAFAHNLKNVDVAIPLGMMVAVTGVSGSGKSTLVHDVLYKELSSRSPEARESYWAASDIISDDDRAALEELAGTGKKTCRRIDGTQHIAKVVLVDQSPIGRTPRSNPVTYMKAFDGIRTLFAALPDARKRGYTPGYFSFNIPGGRCEACEGDGTVTVEMQFLADVELVCEECKGTRFKSGVLEIRFRGRNIHEVLQLTVREAMAFFQGHNPIVQRLRVLEEVGLGYLRLGQSATTLSGGEAQRLKLAAHLAMKESASTLYIFDEPTTGLHFDDINKLLGAFRKLILNNGSVLIIEHNSDIIKTADWVIDLGPEGGDRGGHVVCCGTPETVAACPASYTGRYLRPVLEKHKRWGEQPEVASEPPDDTTPDGRHTLRLV